MPPRGGISRVNSSQLGSSTTTATLCRRGSAAHKPGGHSMVEQTCETDVDYSTETATPVRSVQGMGWPKAFIIGAAVFLYFAVSTVWFPSKVLQSTAIQSSADWIQDIVVTGTWGAALVIGLIGLRLAQRTGWI